MQSSSNAGMTAVQRTLMLDLLRERLPQTDHVLADAVFLIDAVRQSAQWPTPCTADDIITRASETGQTIRDVFTQLQAQQEVT